MPRLKAKDAKFLAQDPSMGKKRVFFPFDTLQTILGDWVKEHIGIDVDDGAIVFSEDRNGGGPGVFIIGLPEAKA